MFGGGGQVWCRKFMGRRWCQSLVIAFEVIGNFETAGDVTGRG